MQEQCLGKAKTHEALNNAMKAEEGGLGLCPEPSLLQAPPRLSTHEVFLTIKFKKWHQYRITVGLRVYSAFLGKDPRNCPVLTKVMDDNGEIWSMEFRLVKSG